MTKNGAASSPGLGDRLVSLVWRSPAGTVGERTRRRVVVHLIPYLFFLYILAYLDRVNVSVAQLKMELPPSEGGVGFDQGISGFGAGLFFWGYLILEIPSTVSVERWGARWVFVRILILWGLCAALVGYIGTPVMSFLFSWLPHLPEQSTTLGVSAFVNGLHDNPKNQFYFLRFMLGFFEGGFFPSVIVYLSLWFRPEDRGKAIAAFMAAIPLSSMLGLPLSGLLLDVHWFGLAGWRWIFIIEGVAPILAGFATIFFLPDRPSMAKWLPADERDWLLAELQRERQSQGKHGHGAWIHHLGFVLVLTLVYFGLNVTSYGLSMFMPAIIKSQLHTSDRTASMVAALPYVMGLIAMLVNGWHSDHTGERFWHVATPLAFLGLGVGVAAGLGHTPVVPAVVMILWVGTCMYAHTPAFWPIPKMVLGATAAASAIGFINMTGNLGGFVGPALVGKVMADQTAHASQYDLSLLALGATPAGSLTTSALATECPRTGFSPAMFMVAGFALVAAVIILITGYASRELHRKPV